MTWTKLPVVPRAVRGRAVVSAKLIRRPDGSGVCQFSLALSLVTEMGLKRGSPARVDVFHDGGQCVKFEFGPDGEALGWWMRTAMMLRAPVPPGVPPGRPSQPMSECVIVKDGIGPGTVVFRLPSSWGVAAKEEITTSPQPRAEVAPASPPRPPPAPAPEPRPSPPPPPPPPPPAPPALAPKPAIEDGHGDGGLDMVEYLRRKGHAATRHPGGLWTMNGESMTPKKILDLVNKYRDRTGLPALTMADVR